MREAHQNWGQSNEFKGFQDAADNDDDADDLAPQHKTLTVDDMVTRVLKKKSWRKE